MPRKTKKEVLDEVSQSPPTTEYKNVIKNKAKYLQQFLKERDHAVKARSAKINNWNLNEQAYNGVPQKTLLTRSNLHLPVVFEGVQNMSANLGAPPEVKYDTLPEGDENASDIMKHVVEQDLDESDWDLLYDDSKIEGGIYGRTIYKVIPGNDSNRVELVDTLAYLISPIAKNTKDALYQGQQFIYKTIEELEEEAEDMGYDQEELHKLKSEKVASETESTSNSEASAKNARNANLGLSNSSNFGSRVAELTEWWTYVKKGKKAELYVFTVANDMYLLRAVPAIDSGLKRPPFVSWGTYSRAVTFWCPSVADIYRDPNLAIDTNINQGIDNATYRNFGMLFVASSSGLKTSSIVPRPLGVTPVTVAPDGKIQDKVWQMPVPEIGDSVGMAQTVKQYADAAAGLAPSASPHQKGKQSVTQQAAQAAKLELKITAMKRHATLACQELYQLMADLTKDRLTKPRKVKVFGYKNLTLEGVTKKNFEGVELIAKAVPNEDSQQNKAIKQKAKIDLYQLFKDDPKVPGQTALRRSTAKTFDIDPDELESWFTADEEQNLPSTPLSPTQAPQPQPAAPTAAPAPTEATPLISATQKTAQAQVPPTI